MTSLNDRVLWWDVWCSLMSIILLLWNILALVWLQCMNTYHYETSLLHWQAQLLAFCSYVSCNTSNDFQSLIPHYCTLLLLLNMSMLVQCDLFSVKGFKGNWINFKYIHIKHMETFLRFIWLLFISDTSKNHLLVLCYSIIYLSILDLRIAAFDMSNPSMGRPRTCWSSSFAAILMSTNI